MEIFDTLEARVERLIEAYRALEQRTTDLEAENRTLREGSGTADELRRRIEALETERTEVRERLERVLGNLAALEL